MEKIEQHVLFHITCENDMKFNFNFLLMQFYQNTAMLIQVMSMSAFSIQQQNRMFATDIMRPAKLKALTYWPFMNKV